MASGDNTGKRNLLGRQPARSLLLDISQPFDQQVCDVLCGCLEDLFSVACSMAGPSRIPLVSIFLLTEQPEVIIPLISLKGNLPRIQNALKTVKAAVVDVSRHLTRDVSCIPQAVHDAVEQYRRQTCTVTQPGLSMNQLEVIVVSCQNAEFVSKKIELISSSLQVQHLKRIVSMTLSPLSLSCGLDDVMLDTSTQSSSPHSPNSGSLISGLVDAFTVDAESASIQNFFRSWLMDCSNDSESLHILFPPQHPGDRPQTPRYGIVNT